MFFVESVELQLYLISVYFDEKSNKRLLHYVEKIAEQTGSTFMMDNHVSPHLTISSVEARDGALLIPYLERIQEHFTRGTIQFVSVGMFFPYVMYVTPVLNGYLQELSGRIYDAVCDIQEMRISKFYRPMQWLPHVTIGKTLYI